jgi:hypothetical protein
VSGGGEETGNTCARANTQTRAMCVRAGECRGQSREERACGPRGAYVTLMAEMIACAVSASSHSAAAFSACQISCLPWKAGSVSQNSSRLDLSCPIVIGVSELHTGAFRQRSLFPGPGTAHHARVFEDARHTPVSVALPAPMRTKCVMRTKRGGEGGAHHRALPAAQRRGSVVDRGLPRPRSRPTLRPRPR